MSFSITLLAETSKKSREEWNQGDLRKINDVLRSKNCPTHFEPLGPTETIDLPCCCGPSSAFSKVLYLPARFIEDPQFNLDVVAFNRKRRKQRHWYHIPSRTLNKIQFELKSHLVSNANIHLPIDFDSIFYVESLERGQWIGSSIRLQKELRRIAKKLDFKVYKYSPDWEKNHYFKIDEFQDDPIGDIKSWLLMYHTIASASLYYKSAIIRG